MKRISGGTIVRAGILAVLVILMGMKAFEGGVETDQKLDELGQEIDNNNEEIAVRSEELSEKLQKELMQAELASFPQIIIKTGVAEFKKIEFKELWNAYGIPFLKNFIIDTLMAGNPNKTRPATVYNQNKILRPGYSLEGEFLAKRAPIVQKALQELVGEMVDFDKLPTIACAFSGGGYRAMVLTAGFMKGLSDLNILNATTYVSALSGSTWYIAPWTLMQRPTENFTVTVDQFNDKLREKIRSNTFNLTSNANASSISLTRVANDAIFPKVVFGQVVNSVDFFGALLAHALLSDFGDKEQRQRLSSQYFSVQVGNAPWPLYTAVSMAKDDDDKYRYHWYEFTPEEVRDLELGLAFPSFAFGRTFESGQSTDFAPEQSFGFQMGIFGSVYSVNLKDIKRIFDVENGTTFFDDKRIVESLEAANKLKFFADVVTNLNDFNALRLVIAKKIIGNLSDSRVGALRAAPAQVNNPFKGYHNASSWLQGRERITFIDAGIDYNIPLRPLFRPDRKVDLIFVGDASSNAGSSVEIKKALGDIERFYQIKYEKDVLMSEATLHVYRPKGFAKGPIVVYMQFFLDQQLIKKSMDDASLRKLIVQEKLNSFEAQRCLDTDYCGTFNFSYTIDNFNQLAAVGEFLIKAHQKKLKQIIQEVVITEEFEFGGEF